jgi:tRNA(Ile2) C34 agmatinyltransferase TiaS
MRFPDWKRISSFILVLGFFSLVGGLVVYVSYEQMGIGLEFFPYRDYAVLLAVAGIVLLVIGNVTSQRAKAEMEIMEEQKPMVDVGYCPTCGGMLDSDVQYCRRCGKKQD